MVRVGVWEDGIFIGVIIFSLGSMNLSKEYCLKMNQVSELARVALGVHEASVTRIISIAIRILAKFCPGIRLIVSFADTTQGHHGGIYQGGNWIYSGLSPRTKEILIDGLWRHWRSAFYKRRELGGGGQLPDQDAARQTPIPLPTGSGDEGARV